VVQTYFNIHNFYNQSNKHYLDKIRACLFKLVIIMT
jgi:hypothetical protein